MNRLFKAVVTFLPHLVIAMSFTILTLSVTDHFNTAMAFINHPMTKGLLLVYCPVSLCVCLILLARWRDRRILRSLIPLLCALITVAMLTALYYDRVNPRDILFAKDFGKTLIFVNTMVSLINAAYTAAAERRRVMEKCKKRRKTQK